MPERTVKAKFQCEGRSALAVFQITRCLGVIVCLGAALLLPGYPAFAQTTDSSDLIHYGDVVDIDVEGGFEFDWRGTLTPEGDLAGLETYGDPVRALCRSEKAVAADAEKLLGKLLRDPKVTVRIVDRSKRALATLDGAIRYPQRFQMRRVALLQELIVMAGGITDEAGGEIELFSPPNASCTRDADTQAGEGAQSNRPAVTLITIADLMGGKPGSNPVVRSGDIITIKASLPIYVIGGVNSPRNIAARGSVTLSRAIAAAGGLSKEANASEIVIFRRQADGSSTMAASLKADGTPAGDEIELKPYDIVDVGQKGGAKRTYPPVIVRPAAPTASMPTRIVE